MTRPKLRNWVPKNPKKYVGDILNIVARSSWEIKMLNWLDNNEHVICYNSEDLKIKYISPVDGKVHTYHPDFLVRLNTKSGEKTYLLEIKPNHERYVPKTKNKKRLLIEMQTYSINQAKWAAAEEFCKKQGIEFLVLDEYSLGIKKKKDIK